MDDFTKFVICTEIPRLDSKSVRDIFIERILSVYGKPQRVRTDSGREFEGHFAALLRELGIEHIKTRAVTPWTNGKAERMVRAVKTLLRRSLFEGDGVSW